MHGRWRPQGRSAQDRARASSTVCFVYFTVHAEGTHLEEIREICVRPAKRYDVSRPQHTTTVGSVDGLMRCFNFTVLCPGSWILDQRQRPQGFRPIDNSVAALSSCPVAERWTAPLPIQYRRDSYGSHLRVARGCTDYHVYDGTPTEDAGWATRTPTNHAHERRVRAHVLGARTRADVALASRHAPSGRAPATPTRPQPPPLPRRAVLFMLVAGVRTAFLFARPYRIPYCASDPMHTIRLWAAPRACRMCKIVKYEFL